MTRKEQILSEVQKKYLNDYTHIASKIDAFVDGAEWADEHPKSGTVNKQEFIAKAKAWVKNCFTGPFAEGMADNIADEFEKYMEE